jgi:hypothetical protein
MEFGDGDGVLFALNPDFQKPGKSTVSHLRQTRHCHLHQGPFLRLPNLTTFRGSESSKIDIKEIVSLVMVTVSCLP